MFIPPKKMVKKFYLKKYVFEIIHIVFLIGPHSNARLCIELIVTQKTEHIPNGTVMHLMVISSYIYIYY